MLLRINPALSLVWRTTESVQIGIPSAIAIVDSAENLELDTIELLRRGVRQQQLEKFRRSRREPDAKARIDTVLAALAPALLSPYELNPQPLPPVHVSGESRIRGPIEDALRVIGVALAPENEAEVIILAAHFVVAPARYRSLLASDQPHLPVVFSDNDVQVGPLVIPGKTACLYCVERQRLDDDSAWGYVVPQLQRRRASAAQGVLIAAAATEITWALTASHSVVSQGQRIQLISRHGQRQTLSAKVHPMCACQSLTEIEKVHEPDVPLVSSARPPTRGEHASAQHT